MARGVHQVCDSEMVRSSLLSKSRAWHGHDSSLVYHLEAVDEVGLLALLFGLLDEFLGEVDLWEAIHGAFDLRASDLLHVIKAVCE